MSLHLHIKPLEGQKIDQDGRHLHEKEGMVGDLEVSDEEKRAGGEYASSASACTDVADCVARVSPRETEEECFTESLRHTGQDTGQNSHPKHD